MKRAIRWLPATLVLLLTTACGEASAPAQGDALATDDLAGAWRTRIQFKSGAFASVKDLEFMVAFNAGGTLTESSNYDAAPPVPPAYGVWRKTGPHQFEAKYEFYATKAPGSFDDIAKGGGWLPGGRGVLTERITLSGDSKTYNSFIAYAAFDSAGKPMDGGGDGVGVGARMGFDGR